MIQAHYYVHCFDGYDPTDTYRLFRTVHLIDAPKKQSEEFSKYLFSALHTDFPDYDPSLTDDILEKIGKIENGEIKSYEYEGAGFTHFITQDQVRLEHTIFDECPEWPVWYCTFAQYKTALQGYRQFLKMPKSIESELTIEFPNN